MILTGFPPQSLKTLQGHGMRVAPMPESTGAGQGELARRVGLAAGELAQARADARARQGRAPAANRGQAGQAVQLGHDRGRRDDPERLRMAIDGLVSQEGWREAATVGAVLGRWREIVGGDVAAHTSPGRLEAGELEIQADSAAWATQVRLLAATLVRRLNEELGHGTVSRVTVRGPAGPRMTGALRIRSGRRRGGAPPRD
jgi:predicted nucleic acid-binding Zn ribbon protein